MGEGGEGEGVVRSTWSSEVLSSLCDGGVKVGVEQTSLEHVELWDSALTLAGEDMEAGEREARQPHTGAQVVHITVQGCSVYIGSNVIGTSRGETHSP